jgi:hypothetical protein
MNSCQFDVEVRNRGYDCRELDAREAWQLMQKWRETFAAAFRATHGSWKLGSLNWHIFSFGHAPSLRGEKAFAEYFSQPLCRFLILPDEAEHLPSYSCVASSWPDFREWQLDLYVCPDSIEWTIAFTHEEGAGLGPYFSRAEWCNIAE